jgi:biopolymer transport protein ExbB
VNEIVIRDWLWASWDYLVQGGWVMVPMVIASVAMWSLIFERMRTYRVLDKGDIESADTLMNTPLRELVADGRGLRRALVRGFLASRSGSPQIDALVLRNATERLRRRLRRRLAVIAVLAGVAPLLGLLGTVLGMIQTFEVIALFGTSNAKAMAGGISVALITTQTGLLVAIPGLFISGSLSRRSARLESRLDEFSLSLARILKSVAATGEGPDWAFPRKFERQAT